MAKIHIPHHPQGKTSRRHRPPSLPPTHTTCLPTLPPTRMGKARLSFVFLLCALVPTLSTFKLCRRRHHRRLVYSIHTHPVLPTPTNCVGSSQRITPQQHGRARAKAHLCKDLCRGSSTIITVNANQSGGVGEGGLWLLDGDNPAGEGWRVCKTSQHQQAGKHTKRIIIFYLVRTERETG